VEVLEKPKYNLFMDILIALVVLAVIAGYYVKKKKPEIYNKVKESLKLKKWESLGRSLKPKVVFLKNTLKVLRTQNPEKRK
jgi:hypothetical protein